MFITKTPETPELIAAVLAGDREAETQLYYRYRNLMFGVGSRCGLPVHELDDCVQITWTRAMGSLAQLRDEKRFNSWISSITRNTANSLHRQRNRESATDGPELEAATAADTADTIVGWEDQQALVTAVKALPADDQELVEMLFVDRVPYKEIAERLNCQPGSVGPTRGRMLARLRSQYLLACAG